MRLPVDLIDRVKGAVVVAGLVACTPEHAPPPRLVPDPPPVSAVAPEAIDPVAYDSVGESERLARLENENDAASSVRDDRIARAEQAARNRSSLVHGIGGVGLTGWSCAGCGRG